MCALELEKGGGRVKGAEREEEAEGDRRRRRGRRGNNSHKHHHERQVCETYNNLTKKKESDNVRGSKETRARNGHRTRRNPRRTRFLVRQRERLERGHSKRGSNPYINMMKHRVINGTASVKDQRMCGGIKKKVSAATTSTIIFFIW